MGTCPKCGARTRRDKKNDWRYCPKGCGVLPGPRQLDSAGHPMTARTSTAMTNILHLTNGTEMRIIDAVITQDARWQDRLRQFFAARAKALYGRKKP